MYFFVRFMGIALLIFGLLFMLVGFGGAVYGFFQNDAVIGLVNTYVLAKTQSVMPQQDIRFYTTTYGLALFLLGMITAAFGQLMLVFVDLAMNTRETNILLRSLRSKDL
jgi:hypothetical protein